MKLIFKKPTDAIQMAGVQVLLYGHPSSGKTSYGLTAPNPILFDFDDGMKRVDPKRRGTYISFDQINTWDKIASITPADLKDFDSIVFDPVSKLISIASDYVGRQNVKYRMASGVLTQQGWGALGMTMKSWLAPFRASGKHIIFTAHEKEEKSNDEVVKRPDISGQIRPYITGDADFVGYTTNTGGKKVVNFSPNDNWYAKNSCNLPSPIVMDEIPLSVVFQTYIDSVNAQSEEFQMYRDQLAEWMDKLFAIDNLDDLNTFRESCVEMKANNMWFLDASVLVGAAMNEKAALFGAVYSKLQNKYEVKS